jgi:Nucleotide modification associated domain 2
LDCLIFHQEARSQTRLRHGNRGTAQYESVFQSSQIRGSWMERCGHNFYSREVDGSWRQHRNQFHIGEAYKVKDTRKPNVFVASRFWYFGRNALETPSQFCRRTRDSSQSPNRHHRGFSHLVGVDLRGIHGLPTDNLDAI